MHLTPKASGRALWIYVNLHASPQLLHQDNIFDHVKYKQHIWIPQGVLQCLRYVWGVLAGPNGGPRSGWAWIYCQEWLRVQGIQVGATAAAITLPRESAVARDLRSYMGPAVSFCDEKYLHATLSPQSLTHLQKVWLLPHNY